MKELRAVLLVGAAVQLIIMQVHSQTAAAKMANSVMDGTVMDGTVMDGTVMDGTAMDTTSITEMEADLKPGPMCCQSRYCAGCPCRKANPKNYLEFLETLQRRREEGDFGDVGGDILRRIPTDEEGVVQFFTLTILDCIICRSSHC